MFKKYRDTFYKTGIVIGVVILFFGLSKILSIEISSTPMYQTIYVIANVLTIVVALKIRDYFNWRKNRALLKWNDIQLLHLELRLELLKDTMFKQLQLSDKEIQEYDQKESKINQQQQRTSNK